MGERKESKFELDMTRLDETGEESGQFSEAAKDNFMSFMEVVWPTVANYYFQVEREISDTIQKASSVKGGGARVRFAISDHDDDIDLHNNDQAGGPQGDKKFGNKKNNCFELENKCNDQNEDSEIKVSSSSGDSSSLSLCTYDCSAANRRRSEASKIKTTGQGQGPSETNNNTKKLVKIQDTNGSVTWDVAETKSSSSQRNHINNVQIKNSIPILVHDPCPRAMFYTTTTDAGMDSVPPDIREALFSADSTQNIETFFNEIQKAIREALSTCFGKISKSFTSSYPRIRFVLNKSYHQIRHTVSCSYPNVQYTINNSYDKVQGAVKSSYPKLRKTVNNSYPKNRIITACYRKFRQLYSSKYPSFSQTATANSLENNQLAKALVDANFDICTRLCGANAEISQALHNSSKKVSISLGTANLEILQSLKNASNRVSKSLVKANSEVLEALAMANDDLQKSLKIAQHEALRTVDTIKKELSKKLFDLNPQVLRKILCGFDDLVRELENANLELLETLSKASTEVCNQISLAHAKYSEAKVNSNYQLSLNLAKANSQVLQVLIQANSKVSDVLEKNSEKVQQITSNFKSGQRPEGLEQKIWKIIEKGETEIWKVAENASFTIESAVETTDSRLWKISDGELHSLRKSVETVEHKLSSAIGSAEWKLKRCAEKLENLVITDTVGHLIQIAWSAVTSFVNENLGRKIFQKFCKQQNNNHNNNKQEGDSSRPDFEMRIPEIENGRGSVQVLVCYNNEYYVGFPDDDDDDYGDNKNYSEEANMNLPSIGPSEQLMNANNQQSNDALLLKIKDDTNASCLVEKTFEQNDVEKTVKISDEEKEPKVLTACSGSLNLISDQFNHQQQQQRASDHLKEIKQEYKKQERQSTTIMTTILEEAFEILNNNILKQDKMLGVQLQKIEKNKTTSSKLILKSSGNINFVHDSKSPKTKSDDEEQPQIIQQKEENSQISSKNLENNAEYLLLPICRKSMDDETNLLTDSAKNLRQIPEHKNCGDDRQDSTKRPRTTTISFHEPFEMSTECSSVEQDDPSTILGTTIQELSASFRTNLQKIHDTLLVSSKQVSPFSSSPLNYASTTTRSSPSLNTFDSVTVLETRQLIEECHKAWNMITSLYHHHNNEQLFSFPELKNESLVASTLTKDINNDSSTVSDPTSHQEEPVQLDGDVKLSESDTIFSYIKWESVSSISQLEDQMNPFQDDKNAFESCDMDLIMKETECPVEVVENVDMSLSPPPTPTSSQTEPDLQDMSVIMEDRPGTRTMDSFEMNLTDDEDHNNNFIISEPPVTSPSYSKLSVNVNDTVSNSVEVVEQDQMMPDQYNFAIEIQEEDDKFIGHYVSQSSPSNYKQNDDKKDTVLIDSDRKLQQRHSSSSVNMTIKEKGKRKLKSISKNLKQALAKTRKASTTLGSVIRKKARIKGWKYKKYCPIPISSLRLCWKGRQETLSNNNYITRKTNFIKNGNNLLKLRKYLPVMNLENQ